jgi:hypothetical protein
MKVALQSTLILVVWIVFWLGGTIGGAVLQARLIDMIDNKRLFEERIC